MTLQKHEHVAGAWAETPSGPGWSNRLVWAAIYNRRDGTYRLHAIQPKEQTEEIMTLMPVAAACSDSLIAAVRRALGGGYEP